MERTAVLVVRLSSSLSSSIFPSLLLAYLLRFTRSCFDPGYIVSFSRRISPLSPFLLSRPFLGVQSCFSPPASHILLRNRGRPTCRRDELCAPVAGMPEFWLDSPSRVVLFARAVVDFSTRLARARYDVLISRIIPSRLRYYI